MVDDVLLRRLVYVKLLYTQALERYERGTEIDLALSVLTLDNSFENMLWIVLGQKNPDQADELKRRQYPPFQSLLNHVKDFKKDLDVSAIRELHEARNLIQHSGITVSRTHMQLYFSKAKTILPSLCEELDIKWTEVSLSRLIKNEVVGEMFRRAEEYFASKEFLKSATMLIKAFEEAKTDRQLNQYGSFILVSRASSDEAVTKNDEDPLRKVVDYANKIYDDLEVLKLGMDYKGWREYRFLLGTLDPDDSLEDIIVELSNRSGLEVEVKTLARHKGVEERTFDIEIFEASEIEIEAWLVRTMPFVLKTILHWEESTGLFDIDELSKRRKDPRYSDVPLVPNGELSEKESDDMLKE